MRLECTGCLWVYNVSVKISPKPVYALLSGVNSATVGIIALAAVQFARKAITDPLTRILVDVWGDVLQCFVVLPRLTCIWRFDDAHMGPFRSVMGERMDEQAEEGK